MQFLVLGRRFPRIAAASAGIALAAGLALTGRAPLLAQDRVTQNGFALSLARLSPAPGQTDVPGYVRFLVLAENNGAIDRAVHARIILESPAARPVPAAEESAESPEVSTDAEATAPARRIRTCTLYLEAPAGGRAQERVACRADNPDEIRLEIVRVFDFTLETEEPAPQAEDGLEGTGSADGDASEDASAAEE